jgi:hypothetical protein
MRWQDKVFDYETRYEKSYQAEKKSVPSSIHDKAEFDAKQSQVFVLHRRNFFSHHQIDKSV